MYRGDEYFTHYTDTHALYDAVCMYVCLTIRELVDSTYVAMARTCSLPLTNERVQKS